MFDFRRAIQGIDTVNKAFDNVTYDDQSQYLYFDFGEQTEDRKVVKAPSVASDVSYDNTISKTTMDTVQEALDQIYMALGWGDVEIYADDSQTAMIIKGAFVNDLNSSILLSTVGANDEQNALIVV